MANRFSASPRVLRPVNTVNVNTTLTFVPVNEDDIKYGVGNDPRHEKQSETVKTEKSVHFATEYESVSDGLSSDSLKTSRVLPSEHLYSGDTFTFDTRLELSDSPEPTTSNPTDLSYDTNTFIALASEDETRTASDISQSESLASSTVFSQPDTSASRDESVRSSTGSSGTVSREWKDVTDIVKDIDELEESEFVTRRDLFFSEDDEATDISESEDEEMAAIQREHFLLTTLRRLKLRDVLKAPPATTLVSDALSFSESESEYIPAKPVSKEEGAFCQQMIDKCSKVKTGVKEGKKDVTESKKDVKKSAILEHYGISSSVVDRLRLENLQHKLARKSAEVEKSIQESLDFIQASKEVEAEMAEKEFLSQMLAQAQRDNTEDRIHAHLIKMHPIKCFAEFVKELPKPDENSREILYKYKRRLEAERTTS